MFEDEVIAILKSSGVNTSADKIEMPPQEEFGDLSFPCFGLAKEQKRNPFEIASSIAAKAKIPKNSSIEKIETKGAYVNFFYKNSKLSQHVLKSIMTKREKYGKPNVKKEKVMIEYSSPNTNKPLHVGHLRNDSIGMSVSNILEFAGNKVIRTAIINDRGVHICKSMLAYQKWGKNKTPQSTGIKPDHFVGDFYVMFEKKLKENPELEEDIHKMLQKWEKKDKHVRMLWKLMNGWVLSGMKETYNRYGSKFDFWTYESDVYDKAKDILEEGVKKKIFFRSDEGDLLAKLEPDLPNKVVLREDGTSIYITQDMSLARMRFEKYKIDKIIYVVASEQNLHFKQLFKILQLLGYKWCDNCHHLSYGLVNLPSGRMKTREGNVVDADDLIVEETNLAKQEIFKRDKKINKSELEIRAKKIALAAIKYYLLKVEPSKDVLFDPDKAISFEGDTGPYIQYAYTRSVSILDKAKNWESNFINNNLNREERRLIKSLSMFPDIIKQSVTDLKPNYICNYAFELAGIFNNFYENHRVLKADNKKVKNFRLTLVSSARFVLSNCLKLMGIEPVEKM